MEDFNIDITLDVYEDDIKRRTFKSKVLSDETIHMIMEDIATALNDEEIDDGTNK